MASKEGQVNIIIKAKDATGGAFSQATKNLQSLGKAAVLGAGVGIAAAGVAVAGFMAKSGSAFVQFEDQMNEVFTLLPGISEEAMGAMRDQVKDAAVEMGRLPEEVIPALYQSLSAGVPADNVFEFLDTAHQAALGGVTDLETAVDGISSVVNAYGADVMDATTASDLMFTAVRLGKTDFGQLSQNLSAVTPLASAMGISFGDVTAALAAMTAQGTPTNQATTQLRALFTELGDSGTEVSQIFEDISGTSFLNFIDSGGSVADVLAMLEEEAIATGVPLQDMFSSVRSGVAALQLTGSGMETFQSNLAEMADSAGATETAYDTMNAGLARGFEVMKATVTTIMLDVGEAIAPVISFLSDKLLKAFQAVQPYIDIAVGALGEFIDVVGPLVDEFGLVEGVLYAVEEALDSFLPEEVMTKVYDFSDTIINDVVPAIQQLMDKVVEFAEPIIEAVTEFVSWKDVLIGIGVAIASVLLPIIGSLIVSVASILAPILAVIAIVALLRNAWENNWGGIRDKVQAVIDFIVPFVQNAIAMIKAWWDANGDAILAKAQAIWQTIQTVVQTVITTVQTIITTVMTAIRTFWEEHGESILATAQRIWQGILDAIQFIIDYIKVIVDAWKAAFEGDWRTFGEKLREAWDMVWNKIKEAVETIIPKIVEAITQFVQDIIAKFNEIDWGQVGRDIIQGIANGISSAATLIKDAALAAAQAAWNAVKGFFGMDSPSKLMFEAGINVGKGLAMGIESSQNLVADSFSGLQNITNTTYMQESQDSHDFTVNIYTSGDPSEIVSSFEQLRAMVIE